MLSKRDKQRRKSLWNDVAITHMTSRDDMFYYIFSQILVLPIFIINAIRKLQSNGFHRNAIFDIAIFTTFDSLCDTSKKHTSVQRSVKAARNIKLYNCTRRHFIFRHNVLRSTSSQMSFEKR